MSEEYAVIVDDVSMMFNLSSEKVDDLKDYVMKLVKGQLFFNEFMALQDVSFKVKKGETFGLVGLNGAGKSTLLKVIAGVLKPTKGKVTLKGTMAPLIELGAGFNPSLTARENIFLNGAVLGYSNKFMQERFDEVIDFSELHEFVDVPIKNFSSGMLARLAFSIATVVDPEILIVDEVLSVGDFKFKEKCENRLKELMKKQTTILFVSHSGVQVKKMCDRAVWLEKGKIKDIGDAREILNEYENE